MTYHSAYKAATILSFLQIIPTLLIFASASAQAASSFIPYNPYNEAPIQSSIVTSINRDQNDKARSEVKMRAWTCHGRTQKEMVEKLASVSDRWISGTGNSIPHMSKSYVTYTLRMYHPSTHTTGWDHKTQTHAGGHDKS